jgi:hypothetical protein
MEALDWLAAWPGAVWLRNSGTAYLFVNAAHILGIGLLLGSILPLDLHLIGLLRSSPLAVVGPLLLRTASTGVALAVLTGFWLFSVKPREYVANPAFLSKLGLLAFAFGNIGLQHFGPRFRVALHGQSVHPSVRILAALSMLLWLSVLVAGRWIGFV